MIIIGIDLSGPSNAADTALVSFECQESVLKLTQSVQGASDADIFHLVSERAKESGVTVGLDAPLSYNDGGKDRPSDSELRSRIVAAGLRSGSVMTPTMNRMAYLTLRGISVAHQLLTIPSRPSIVEVHPGAVMALRGAPIDAVRSFKKSPEARMQLLNWLEQQGLQSVVQDEFPTDHYVAACAAALATWKWSLQESVWLHSADPPAHPFDFAC